MLRARTTTPRRPARKTTALRPPRPTARRPKRFPARSTPRRRPRPGPKCSGKTASGHRSDKWKASPGVAGFVPATPGFLVGSRKQEVEGDAQALASRWVSANYACASPYYFLLTFLLTTYYF